MDFKKRDSKRKMDATRKIINNLYDADSKKRNIPIDKETRIIVNDIVDDLAKKYKLPDGVSISKEYCDGDEDCKIDTIKFIFLLYQSISSMSTRPDGFEPLNPYNVVHKMLDSKHSGGAMDITAATTTTPVDIGVYFTSEDRFERQRIDKLYNHLRNDADDEILNTLEMSGYFGDGEAHSNVTVFLREKLVNGELSEKLTTILYEPHGFLENSTDIANLFNTGIMSIWDKNGRWSKIVPVTRKEFSGLGFQTISNDDVGYCTMFSALWLYILLSISKIKRVSESSSDEITLQDIKDIELLVMKRVVETDNDILKIVQNFAYDMYSYISLKTDIDQESLHREFKSVGVDEGYMKRNFEYIMRKMSTSRKNQLKRNEDVQTASGGVKKVEDNKTCDGSKDCLSGICYKNKCVGFAECAVSKDCLKSRDLEQKKDRMLHLLETNTLRDRRLDRLTSRRLARRNVSGRKNVSSRTRFRLKNKGK